MEADPYPDWVVIARLMWGHNPGQTPTRTETRIAVWIMLDRGYTCAQIQYRAGLDRKVVEHVIYLRNLAAQPDRKAKRRNAWTPRRARQESPQRYPYVLLVLAGVRAERPALPSVPVTAEMAVLVGAAS